MLKKTWSPLTCRCSFLAILAAQQIQFSDYITCLHHSLFCQSDWLYQQVYLYTYVRPLFIALSTLGTAFLLRSATYPSLLSISHTTRSSRHVSTG
ncbi:hypothetical protein IWZ03DRAFT_37731 [Phyllosticta citriasiana]|uniref:Secreted protein n=1 Tax=Phyllosticta citriasiana TaxID=595635 RepID=A0ABR1KD78_9PEZI